MALGTPYTVVSASEAVSSGTTYQQTVAHSVARHDAVVVNAFNNLTTVTGVTDSQGNLYVLQESDDATSLNTYQFVALDMQPLTIGVDWIKLTFGSLTGTAQISLIARGCSGVATSSAVDPAATFHDSAAATPVLTGRAARLIGFDVAAGTWSTANTSIGPGQTHRLFHSGSLPSTFSADGTPDNVTIIVSYKTPTAQSTITSYINSIPAGREVWIIYRHEPENDVQDGGPTFVSEFKTEANKINSVKPSNVKMVMCAEGFAYHSGFKWWTSVNTGQYLLGLGPYVDYFSIDIYQGDGGASGGDWPSAGLSNYNQWLTWLSLVNDPAVVTTVRPLAITEYGVDDPVGNTNRFNRIAQDWAYLISAFQGASPVSSFPLQSWCYWWQSLSGDPNQSKFTDTATEQLWSSIETTGASGDTLDQESEWIVTALHGSNATGGVTSWGGGFTQASQQHQTGEPYCTVADQVVASTAPVTATATLPASGTWSISQVALKSATKLPLFGMDAQAPWTTVEAALGITSIPGWRGYNSGMPASWPGADAPVPAGVTLQVVSFKPALPISAGDQATLATLFSEMPAGSYATIWNEGEKSGYTPAQLITGLQLAYTIFKANAPASCKFGQIINTNTADSSSPHFPMPQWVATQSGGAAFDFYAAAWFPNSSGDASATTSVNQWLTALKTVVPNPVIAVTECNFSSGTGGVTWSGSEATWFSDAWNWAIANGALLFFPYFNSASGIPWPPDSGCVAELTAIAHGSVPGSPAVTTTSLPAAEVGAAYSASVAATGGTPPYTWAVIAGALPPGLSLNASTGAITGTPTSVGVSSATFQATDAAAAIGSAVLAITVAAALAVSTSSLPGGNTGAAYSAALATSGGTGSVSWSITSGALPAGLALNASTGAITGTPTTAGTSSFTVQARDTYRTATRSLSIAVTAPSGGGGGGGGGTTSGTSATPSGSVPPAPVLAPLRYAATDLITGQVLSDFIPLEVQSFSQYLNGGGSLTGQLDLSKDAPANRPFTEALECRRALLWVLAGNYPVWAGGVWDWPDQTRAQGVLPISAQTIDFLFTKRLITSDLAYTSVDIFTVFADLVRYGTTKSSSYITASSPTKGPASPLVGAAAAIAGLVLPGTVARTAWTASYNAADLGSVADALNGLVQAGNLEYVFQPGLDSSGNLAIFLRLGWNQLGRAPNTAGYSVTYPGNASDYGYPRTGSQSANYVWATAPPNGAGAAWQSAYPHGVDLADLEAGYPLMETAVSWPGSQVTSQAQIDGFADGTVTQLSQAMTMPVIVVPDGQRPTLLDLTLGDAFEFAATSPLHPANSDGSPGLQQLVRLAGWQCYPAGPSQSQYVQLQTSGVVATL